jgi:3' exoribonuclease, RNase T-like
MMEIFFDSEFTGLHQGTSLISLGAVSSHGHKFYAEFDDYNRKQVDDWVRDNVITKLSLAEPFFDKNSPQRGLGVTGTLNNLRVYGSTDLIAHQFHLWMDQFKEPVEAWSDCLSYDWVLLNEMYGGALSKPDILYYIPFDICTLFKICGVDPDISREEYAGLTNSSEKHNALWDAIVIKACYEKLIHSVKGLNGR